MAPEISLNEIMLLSVELNEIKAVLMTFLVIMNPGQVFHAKR